MISAHQANMSKSPFLEGGILPDDFGAELTNTHSSQTNHFNGGGGATNQSTTQSEGGPPTQAYPSQYNPPHPANQNVATQQAHLFSSEEDDGTGGGVPPGDSSAQHPQLPPQHVPQHLSGHKMTSGLPEAPQWNAEPQFLEERSNAFLSPPFANAIDRSFYPQQNQQQNQQHQHHQRQQHHQPQPQPQQHQHQQHVPLHQHQHQQLPHHQQQQMAHQQFSSQQFPTDGRRNPNYSQQLPSITPQNPQPQHQLSTSFPLYQQRFGQEDRGFKSTGLQAGMVRQQAGLQLPLGQGTSQGLQSHSGLPPLPPPREDEFRTAPFVSPGTVDHRSLDRSSAFDPVPEKQAEVLVQQHPPRLDGPSQPYHVVTAADPTSPTTFRSAPISKPPRAERVRKHAVASKHCHICGKAGAKGLIYAVCSSIETGRCVKSYCINCVKAHNLTTKCERIEKEASEEKTPRSEQERRRRNAKIAPEDFKILCPGWLCPHCSKTCPEEARCFRYSAYTQERRRQRATMKKLKVAGGEVD